VWLSVIALLGSGLYLIAAYGGFGAVGWYVHAMLALGVLMMLIFAHVFFALFPRLRKGVAPRNGSLPGLPWPKFGY